MCFAWLLLSVLPSAAPFFLSVLEKFLCPITVTGILFSAVLDLFAAHGLSLATRDRSLVVVHGLLTVVAALGVERGL